MASTITAPQVKAGAPSRVTGWRGTLGASDPLVLVTLVLLPVMRLLMVLPVKPSVYADGRTYRVANTWLDFSWTSLDGYSVRPWGVTAFMALWPGDRAIMYAQAVLSGIAWAAFAAVIAVGIANVLVRRIFVVAIVLLACSAQLANWDSVIQGDSLPMSTGVLALAALVWLVREPRWGRAGLFAAAALWFSMTRPNTFVVLVVWALGLLVVGLLRRRVLVLGVTAALLVAFSGYAYVYNMRSDQAWSDKMGWARTTVGMAFPLGKYDPVAKEVIADLSRTDAPRCLIPASPADVTKVGTTGWIATRVAVCPGVDEWGAKNWHGWWIGWLVDHPRSAFKIVRSQLPESLAPSVWGEVVAATPNSVSEVFLGTRTLPQDAYPTRTYRTQPLLLWFAAAASLAVVAGSRRLWRGSSWGTDIALAASVLGGLGSAITSGLLIQTTPHEVAQESLGVTAVITASAVALVAVGLDRVLGARPRPRAATASSEGRDEEQP